MHKKITTRIYHEGEKGTQRRNTITNLALREGYSPVPPSCALVVKIHPGLPFGVFWVLFPSKTAILGLIFVA
jgi:hypothetical protein